MERLLDAEMLFWCVGTAKVVVVAVAVWAIVSSSRGGWMCGWLGAVLLCGCCWGMDALRISQWSVDCRFHSKHTPLNQGLLVFFFFRLD